MKRRRFLASIGAAAGAIASPAVAQGTPELSWRLASSFPRSLDIIHGAAEVFARAVAEMTDNRFRLQVSASGEVVPGLQVAEAVGNGTVEAGHTASGLFIGRDPTFAFGGAVPFGLNSRGFNAWWTQGDGERLMNEFYATQKLRGLIGGNTGAQMGGWFRREVRTVADLNGLRMRIGGFEGRILQKLGVVPQPIGGSEIVAALERGAIDAAEWLAPHDDEKLGFGRVAPFYYFPGWWEGSASFQFFINLDRWNALPRSYQGVLQSAAQLANVDMQARYDARNPAALKRVVAGGAQLRPFSPEIMQACFRAAQELYVETAAANPQFKRVLDSYVAFRSDHFLWWQVAEFNMDNFMVRAKAAGQI